MNIKKLTALAAMLAMLASAGSAMTTAYADTADNQSSQTQESVQPLTQAGGSISSGSYSLSADITLTSPLIIDEGSTVTIDLNGYTINGSDLTKADGEPATAISSYGTLIINDSGENGTIIGAKNGVYACNSNVTVYGGTISGVNNGIYADSNAEVTIYGGTISGTDYNGIYAGNEDDPEDNSTVTVCGGTISGANCGIWAENTAAVTLLGGSFTGGSREAIYIYDSDLYIGNGTDICTIALSSDVDSSCDIAMVQAEKTYTECRILNATVDGTIYGSTNYSEIKNSTVGQYFITIGGNAGTGAKFDIEASTFKSMLHIDTMNKAVTEPCTIKNVTANGEDISDITNSVSTAAVYIRGQYDDLEITKLTVPQGKGMKISGDYGKNAGANVTMTDCDIYALYILGLASSGLVPDVMLNGGSYDFVNIDIGDVKLTIDGSEVGDLIGGQYITKSIIRPITDEVTIISGTFANASYSGTDDSGNAVEYNLSSFVDGGSVSYTTTSDNKYVVVSPEDLTADLILENGTFKTSSDQGTYSQITVGEVELSNQENILFTITREADSKQFERTLELSNVEASKARIALTITDIPEDQSLTVDIDAQ